jgi:rubrerythrin
MKSGMINELIFQALETEVGGVKVYEAAIRCAKNEDLKSEWKKYQQQTKRHVEILEEICEEMGLDAEDDTPGRRLVRQKGEALIGIMEQALKNGNPDAAQLVAAEAVVDAETKDHMNWELIGKLVEELEDEELAEKLRSACEEVEDEEDEHLYHTMGWTRELWIEALGMKAVLPPPEEKRDVRTATEAAKAKKDRKAFTPK